LIRFGGIRFLFKPLIFNTPKLGEFGGGEISHILKNIINYLFCPYDVNLSLFLLFGWWGRRGE